MNHSSPSCYEVYHSILLSAGWNGNSINADDLSQISKHNVCLMHLTAIFENLYFTINGSTIMK